MKWSRSDLQREPNGCITFDDTITFGPDAFERIDRLRGLRDVAVSGQLLYEPEEDRVDAHLDIEGVMIVPCSITMEDVEVPFSTSSDEVFTFVKNNQNSDVHECKGDVVELLPVIFQLILMEIPLKVVKPGLKDYPKGNGWEVVKEEEYRKAKADTIDPRLAKLKEFKIEE